MHGKQWTIYSAHHTVHKKHCTVYSAKYTVHSIQCTVNSAQYTVHIIESKVYNAQYTVQCTLYCVPVPGACVSWLSRGQWWGGGGGSNQRWRSKSGEYIFSLLLEQALTTKLINQNIEISYVVKIVGIWPRGLGKYNIPVMFTW